MDSQEIAKIEVKGDREKLDWLKMHMAELNIDQLGNFIYSFENEMLRAKLLVEFKLPIQYVSSIISTFNSDSVIEYLLNEWGSLKKYTAILGKIISLLKSDEKKKDALYLHYKKLDIVSIAQIVGGISNKELQEELIKQYDLLGGEKGNVAFDLIDAVKEPKVRETLIEKCDDVLEKEDLMILISGIKDDDTLMRLTDRYKDKFLPSERMVFISRIQSSKKRVESIIKNIKIDYKSLQKAMQTDKERLGLPEKMTIGIELEFSRIPYDAIALYSSSGILSVGNKYMKDWNIEAEGSIPQGAEATSPILHDTEVSWQELSYMCAFLKDQGAEITPDCGGHIHIGANYLEDNAATWTNLLTIWSQAEPLLYKMSNKKNDVMREGTEIYAYPNTERMQKLLAKGSIQLDTPEDLEQLIEELQPSGLEGTARYASLNISNIVSRTKHTFEFRMPNGSLDPKVIRDNVYLFARVLITSKEMANNLEYKKKEFEVFLREDVSEAEKAKAFTDLIFDDEKKKKLYLERWESVKDNEEYEALTPSPKFRLTDFKKVSEGVFIEDEKEIERLFLREVEGKGKNQQNEIQK